MKIRRKQFKFAWVTTQVCLLVLPILIGLFYTPYEISYDKEYVATVPQRVFEDNNKLTDFKEATVAKYDSEGTYVKKIWKLKHQELYYFDNVGMGLLIGLTFQMCNLIWLMISKDLFGYSIRGSDY